MNDGHFATASLRLCALAARALGWRPAEFWASTPTELATVLAPPGGGQAGLSRPELNRMMEHDHG